MKPFAFLTEARVREIQKGFETPVFVYDQQTLEENARQALDFPNSHGLTARYAMKALPTGAVVRALNRAGMQVDASSGFEVHRALRAGVPPSHILLTAQQLPQDLSALLAQGVGFNAGSLRQLRGFGVRFPGREVTLRVNPGLGSGHNNRTNVGGPASSFGIWHGDLGRILEIQKAHDLKITRLHTHIGSGGNPQIWERCALLALDIASRLPDVQILNLGGGFKVGRMPGESSADLRKIGLRVAAAVREFREQHGRALKIEIEPGTWIVANAGVLIFTVIDTADTGPAGYTFLKADGGMTEILRPSLYGAQHPLWVVAAEPGARERKPFLVVGHCCESGDLLTPEPGNPEGLSPRELPEARVGDALVVGGAGAYCSGMSAKNYNSFPEAAEVMIDRDGRIHLIRERQTLQQLIVNERLPEQLN